jgi:hypothetical protein
MAWLAIASETGEMHEMFRSPDLYYSVLAPPPTEICPLMPDWEDGGFQLPCLARSSVLLASRNLDGCPHTSLPVPCVAFACLIGVSMNGGHELINIC